MGARFETLKLLAIASTIVCAACAPAKFANVTQDTPGKTETPPEKTTDAFVQDESANKVDILIVDDNSYSMDPDQRKMAAKFGSFTSGLSGLDYQIGLTTTDLNSTSQHYLDGRLVNWEGTGSPLLKHNNVNGETLFKNTVSRKETIGCVARGDCPAGDEQPLKAIIRAIEQRATANAGFFRDHTDLAVVVLSDEDELSNGPSNATKPTDVMRAFQAAFGDTKRLAVYGIVIPPGDVACQALQILETEGGNGAFFGISVDLLARLTGGTTSSICDADYSRSLAGISQQVRKLVGSFELRQTPRSRDGLQVKLTPTPSTAITWKLEGNRIVFDTPPAAGTRIEVSYSY